MVRKHLGVLSSHPIQYQAPLFRALAARLDLTVFFAHRQTPAQQAAAGFGVEFEWDIDLLSGYDHLFLQNRARRPATSRFMGCDTPEIATIIAERKFDAFLVCGWHLLSYWQAIRACRRYGVPVFVRGDSHLGTPRILAKRLAKEGLYRWVMRQFVGYFYVGQRNLEYLLHYGADRRWLFFAPHFVDNAWFRERAAAAALRVSKLRQDLGIAEGDRVLLFVGKLLPAKRPQDIIRACAETALRDQECHVVFVGSGPLDADLRAETESRRVRATLAGFRNQSELATFYKLGDVLILPSGRETWGLAVNEAMACGTPAVVSDAVGCAPDLIEEGVTGSVYPVGNIDALASAIRRMLDRKATPTVQDALRRKMDLYSVDTSVEAVLEALDHVSAKRSKLQGRS
jgi:glycosyltransferase involved in cell wall biosynthesis